MDHLCGTFERLRQAHRKALIPFIMGGDPDLSTTKALLRALADAGADLIEVGIPFSDPLADGPIIQRASARALASGTTPQAVLHAVAEVAPRLRVPVAILSYWNPVLQYQNGRRGADGPETFAKAAVRSGVGGLIVPDLPLEEARAFQPQAARAGLCSVLLATPTSPAERLRQIARLSQGFIYYVSVTGTTGVRRELNPEWLHGVRQLKRMTTKPICVGFGVSTPAQAHVISRAADGVIVGSALLQAMEPYLARRRTMVGAAAAFVRRLRRAV